MLEMHQRCSAGSDRRDVSEEVRVLLTPRSARGDAVMAEYPRATTAELKDVLNLRACLNHVSVHKWKTLPEATNAICNQQEVPD